MRIDPSQISEPLAHILGVKNTSDVEGQQTSAASRKNAGADQIEQLDQMLLRRLQMLSNSDSAEGVSSYAQAQDRLAQVLDTLSENPEALNDAQGNLDASRVRGLLD